MSQSTDTGTRQRKPTSAAKQSTKSTKTTAKARTGSQAKAPQGKKSMPAAATGQDAIVMLKDDHKVVEKLFKQFEKAGESAPPAQKRQIVDQVIRELTTHAFIEETLFYPTARQAAPETGEHVLESVEEHHVVAWMLAELKNTDPSDERFDAKMAVLMENVRHHVQEEEQDWFPEVRKAMSRTELKELGAMMEAAKSDAPADPLALSSAKA
jgi:hemerythrin superfamily protein